MCDKKQNSFVKRVHLFTDDGLYNRKAFCKVKIVFYSSPVEVIQNVLFYRTSAGGNVKQYGITSPINLAGPKPLVWQNFDFL